MFYDIQQVFVNEDSKKNFIKGLIKVIKADGEIHELEKDFFVELSQSFGLDEDALYELNQLLEEEDNDAAISVQFDNDIEKIVFLKEAFQLALIDGVYHEYENRVIYEIAQNLGLEKDFILDMEKWTLTGLNWYQQGLELFGISEELI